MPPDVTTTRATNVPGACASSRRPARFNFSTSVLVLPAAIAPLVIPTSTVLTRMRVLRWVPLPIVTRTRSFAVAPTIAFGHASPPAGQESVTDSEPRPGETFRTTVPYTTPMKSRCE